MAHDRKFRFVVICQDLQARRDRWQMSYLVVPEEFVDVFAPVVSRLAGT